MQQRILIQKPFCCCWLSINENLAQFLLFYWLLEGLASTTTPYALTFLSVVVVLIARLYKICSISFCCFPCFTIPLNMNASSCLLSWWLYNNVYIFLSTTGVWSKFLTHPKDPHSPPSDYWRIHGKCILLYPIIDISGIKIFSRFEISYLWIWMCSWYSMFWSELPHKSSWAPQLNAVVLISS